MTSVDEAIALLLDAVPKLGEQLTDALQSAHTHCTHHAAPEIRATVATGLEPAIAVDVRYVGPQEARDTQSFFEGYRAALLVLVEHADEKADA